MKKKSFLMKWLFPPTFSVLFYPVIPILWFLMFDEWERNWSNSINFFFNMCALYSIFYLAMDSDDGRFTKFIKFVDNAEKWKSRIIVGLIFVVWFLLIAFANHYFPLDIS